MSRVKPHYTARQIAMSILNDEISELADINRKRAVEVEAVNRANGFDHIAPDICREKAALLEEFASRLREDFEKEPTCP